MTLLEWAEAQLKLKERYRVDKTLVYGVDNDKTHHRAYAALAGHGFSFHPMSDEYMAAVTGTDQAAVEAYVRGPMPEPCLSWTGCWRDCATNLPPTGQHRLTGPAAVPFRP
jgi:hypothetical protein